MKNRTLFVFLIFYCAQILWSGEVWGQTFTTNSNGDWANSSTIRWIRTNPSSCATQYASPPPTNPSNISCAIDVIINHSITKTGNNTFAQRFRSLKLNSTGNLIFTGNTIISATNNAYGAIEITIDGGSLELYNLHLTNGAKLKIINGGKLKIRNDLTTGGNASSIEVDESSTLEIENQIKLGGSNASATINGTISAKSIITEGGNDNKINFGANSKVRALTVKITGASSISFQGLTIIEDTFEIEGYASSAQLSPTADFTVMGNTILKGSASFTLEGKTTLNGNLDLEGNTHLVSKGLTIIEGDVTTKGSSALEFSGFSTINGTVALLGNTSLAVIDNGDVLITKNLEKPQYSSAIRVQNKGQLVICSNRLGGNSGLYPPITYSNMSIAPSPAYYGGCRILPVDLLYFNTSYRPQDHSALLHWSTAKEWENSHFEIERAVNSVKEWETIGQVEGNGYSERPEKYSFTDTELPTSGGNIFYRLKQVDFSDKSSYSMTRSLQVDAINSKTVWVAYPNPSTHGSKISVDLLQLNQYQDELISLRLINLLGEGESAILTTPEDISQVVSGWLLPKKAGLYILDIHWGTNSQQIKLLRN
ncbi:autotransporter adhesin family protein [Algoriphagus sp. AGSA1]|uniref:autotransporter adhesin family protein n=1 Tax=Algoriphagus sp. AGSA1 TaxID=2907213 RepID=UPI001F2259B2|nr:autotransporter adhesin family protein [Algoriphagus sp. AGSA1]MCE7058182.1 autotransporter adhesin family protein [Algoriphagus sp. AGSA1]